ncbi:50S ribosomal protein L19 [Mycoplasma iguanae]|uniref:Large ribosomal subunit protein bL19 n=1 Tax=Mycoplasma iguanae TaxID=292461 RepID=A0ABY5RB52_9MOLU|nr:50S ribosomal protein L19 [Mycoplasma iguanae]UVD81445.1 50S ribosomal protein L19 [Mycoplasma iguanae]
MQNRLIDLVENSQIRNDLPDFRVGDNLKVHVRIKEGSKERIQIFEGLVIAKKHQGTKETFTVRKISYGVGVERTFPVNSPLISTIEVVRSNKIRRAKLYYMRDRKGKSARLKELRRPVVKTAK